MSVHTLPMPAELKRELEQLGALPRDHRGDSVRIVVRPQDDRGRRCAAWRADHYEIHAFYTSTDEAALGPLEAALRERPEVQVTTQVVRGMLSNPQQWPTARWNTHPYSRPQVWALFRDGGGES